ncbi:DUF4197 domain-containing protein [Uliginosibacterium sp. 31-16]|uniref:DUF4197 domain-containing protein n=1 Tax=Uliginosibacterium sp. 31-16 TaxID=3068315 RepID=UPI00273DCF22|nr:DUF4197 domain-containing protein [Uliginosibacterium sp. 31-16]MDP5240976.1 DUF4197 domain-containing protein [Uliginosibacterium sp. 31-16]
MTLPRLLCSALLAFSATLAQAGLLDSFSDKDAAGGMREALSQGAEQAVKMLGKEDGFLGNPKVRIELPGRLQQAESALRMMGQGKAIDELKTNMNRAAEQAVPEARALLVAAVKQMSVQDVKNVLTGGEDAATQYFREKTSAQLSTRFLPIVSKVTGRLAVAQQYNQIAGKAAGFGLLKAEDASVEQYVTKRALDGLYLMIAEQEREIRQNPAQAAGSLAKKIFGALGN